MMVKMNDADGLVSGACFQIYIHKKSREFHGFFTRLMYCML
ncbi:hypothetical protein TCEL_00016 [Thermobrachium celere DSM 8682]|uniref:Uncharacterized protein n=1 Tax=Thermobrachium celere DSM 8682 TaxID=941824 RepID=R7RLT9_9CLOT|nr:hypothetical protein TCEL_00016 [Thermobrachium celere DSM 8682]